MKQESKVTIRKVKYATAGAGVAGAVVVVLVWLAQMYNIEVPQGVQEAFTIILPVVFGWVAGYITEPSASDNIVPK